MQMILIKNHNNNKLITINNNNIENLLGAYPDKNDSTGASRWYILSTQKNHIYII